MAQSEKIDELAKALCEFQFEVKPIKRTADNDGIKKGGKAIKYADLGEQIESTRELAHKHGLSVSGTSGVIVAGDKVYCTIETTLFHISGQWKSGEQLLFLTRKAQGGGVYESLDSQTQGSSISYARRYGHGAILGLVQEDDDGQAATTEQRRILVEGPELEEQSEPEAEVKSGTVAPEQWQELFDMAVKNGWTSNYVQLQYDSERIKGKHANDLSILYCLKAKFSKQNEKAVL